MKRFIHLIFTICMLPLINSGLQAQSASGGSRLNMAGKKKPVSAAPTRFSSFTAAPSYKPLSLQNPKALNKFYTSFLFSPNTASDSNLATASDSPEKTVDRKSPAVEAHMRLEEQLFSNDKISVSNIYPNPASEYAEIDFAISPGLRDARLTFYNVLGSQLSEYTLNKNDRKLRINTKDMPTGLYFYQLSVDGQKVATKKMLVRHQQ